MINIYIYFFVVKWVKIYALHLKSKFYIPVFFLANGLLYIVNVFVNISTPRSPQ